PDATGTGVNVLSVIPTGTTIPARGHYLVGNNSAEGSYSLSVPLDQSYSADIPDNSGVALFSSALPAHLTLAYRLDAVGFNNESDNVPPLFIEGAGLAPSGATLVAAEQYAYVRRLPNGVPQDTNNN